MKYIFGQWEEARVSGANPRVHRENMQTVLMWKHHALCHHAQSEFYIRKTRFMVFVTLNFTCDPILLQWLQMFLPPLIIPRLHFRMSLTPPIKRTSSLFWISAVKPKPAFSFHLSLHDVSHSADRLNEHVFLKALPKPLSNFCAFATYEI